MDSRVFLALFLCLFFFLVFFPHDSHSRARIPNLIEPKPKPIVGSVIRMKRVSSSATFDPSRVSQLSWSPRAFIYKNFLSEQECDHLINLARDRLEESMVADNESGKSIKSEVRTSSGMFLLKAQNGEAMQILHYEHGQKYEPHFDYFHDKANQELGGHRVATVLMYLSNVGKGGETVFPNAKVKMVQGKDEVLSDCAKNGYSVRPFKGDALLFYGLHPNATTDPSSLHGSCPVIEGEKWSATKWIHVRSFEKSIRSSSGCTDENENCASWAKAGECEKNSAFMVGSKDLPGFCRKSCKFCSS